MAERRSAAAHAAAGTAAGTQFRLAASEQRRHHRDAGQVGIPMVRGLGPGLSRRLPGADRSEFREEPAAAAARVLLYAPDWPMSRLGMGIRRLHPAGTCLGCVARLRNR